MATPITKGVLIFNCRDFQYLCKKEVVIIFANSKADAIIMTSVFAPPNSFERPVTEKKAAAPAKDNADNATKNGNMYFFMV
jgi:hypothetical protein